MTAAAGGYVAEKASQFTAAFSTLSSTFICIRIFLNIPLYIRSNIYICTLPLQNLNLSQIIPKFFIYICI